MDWKLEVIVVPVEDPDRAKEFYVDKLGFTLDVDHRDGAFRVIQTTPPGSACSITFGTGLNPSPPGSLGGLQITVPDIDEAHRQLVDNNIENSGLQHFVHGQPRPGRDRTGSRSTRSCSSPIPTATDGRSRNVPTKRYSVRSNGISSPRTRPQ